MTLQSSGTISLNDIATEFGGSTPHSLSEYYGASAGIPSSGAISFSDFYGASNLPTSTCASTYTLWSSYGYGTNSTSWIVVGNRYTNCTNGSCYTGRTYIRSPSDSYAGDTLYRTTVYSRILKNGTQVVYVSGYNNSQVYSSYINITCNNDDHLQHQKRQSRAYSSSTYVKMFAWIYSGVNDSTLLTTS